MQDYEKLKRVADGMYEEVQFLRAENAKLKQEKFPHREYADSKQEEELQLQLEETQNELTLLRSKRKYKEFVGGYKELLEEKNQELLSAENQKQEIADKYNELAKKYEKQSQQLEQALTEESESKKLNSENIEEEATISKQKARLEEEMENYAELQQKCADLAETLQELQQQLEVSNVEVEKQRQANQTIELFQRDNLRLKEQIFKYQCQIQQLESQWNGQPEPSEKHSQSKSADDLLTIEDSNISTLEQLTNSFESLREYLHALKQSIVPPEDYELLQQAFARFSINACNLYEYATENIIFDYEVSEIIDYSLPEESSMLGAYLLENREISERTSRISRVAHNERETPRILKLNLSEEPSGESGAIYLLQYVKKQIFVFKQIQDQYQLKECKFDKLWAKSQEIDENDTTETVELANDVLEEEQIAFEALEAKEWKE